MKPRTNKISSTLCVSGGLFYTALAASAREAKSLRFATGCAASRQPIVPQTIVYNSLGVRIALFQKLTKMLVDCWVYRASPSLFSSSTSPWRQGLALTAFPQFFGQESAIENFIVGGTCCKLQRLQDMPAAAQQSDSLRVAKVVSGQSKTQGDLERCGR
jgi:hypothetical protein